MNINGELTTLKSQHEQVLKSVAALVCSAAQGGRDLTAEELRQHDAYMAKMLSIEMQAERLKPGYRATLETLSKVKLAAAEAPPSTASAPAAGVPAGTGALFTRLRAADDPKHGFKSFGEFALSVRNASDVNRAVDERLFIGAAAPSTYGGEATGLDGGFLVPTEFAKEVTTLSLDSTSLLPLTDQLPVAGNSLSYPSDETAPWSGANGVRAFWTQEAALATATKPIVKPNVMRLNKLVSYVPLTDELLGDAVAAGVFLTSRFARAIKWKTNDAIVNGDGAGQPFGILTSPALVVINKDAGQATGTISGTNLANMFGAMPVDYLESAVWLVAPDAMPKLITAQIQNVGLWTGPGSSVQYAPGGFLLGKPVIPTQACAAMSSQGDIIFTSLKAYTTISKDIAVASSMHLYFDADATAFRATFRMDGQPSFKGTVTQARGTQAMSPYITLQAR